jgi:hypothetical protein
LEIKGYFRKQKKKRKKGKRKELRAGAWAGNGVFENKLNQQPQQKHHTSILKFWANDRDFKEANSAATFYYSMQIRSFDELASCSTVVCGGMHRWCWNIGVLL